MKSFSFTKSHISIFITLLVVLFFGCLYFFIYLPQNEKRVQEQRFRSLQTIDENIHAKIDNSVALMNNLLTSYKQGDSTAVKQYVELYEKDKFTLTVPRIVSLKEPAKREITDSGYNITVSNTNQLITLKLQQYKPVNGTGDTLFYQMSMQLTFEQFIKGLLPQSVFDQYVVFSNEAVVYETFSSGISSIKDTALVKDRDLVSSPVRSINAGGKDYKLFLQTIQFTADQKWQLAGLLGNVRYRQEKNQLPSNIILLLVTAMFIILVAFPWIKLYQMGSKDRLTMSDGIASVVVSMLLMSLLFFSFFKYNRTLRPIESPDAKNFLATQIISAFRQETDTMYEKLRQADSWLAGYSNFKMNVKQMHEDSAAFETDSLDTISETQQRNIASIVADTSIKQLFWLDKDGIEQRNWTYANQNAPHSNYGARDYFKKIATGKTYFLNNDLAKPFYLDQLVSWTTGNFTSVISIPSAMKGQQVAAMSFNMKSLDRPVLPTGYFFAIIDNNAKVLYHSDVFRNLNENLLTEFSASDKLKGCLSARTADVFETNYFSNQYNVLMKPLERLPYSIIIFSDLSYKASRDMEIYSFTISMLMLLFGVLIIQLFVVFLVSSKRSFFKKQSFDNSWIGPKIHSHGQYNVAICFNMVIILLAVLFFNISAFLAYVYILLFAVTFISVFLISLFMRRYKANDQPDLYAFKRIAFWWLIVLIVLLDLTALKILDTESNILFFTYQLLSLIAADLLYTYLNRKTMLPLVTWLRKKREQHKKKKWLAPLNRYWLMLKRYYSRWNYVKSFTLMSLTRIIITSGIPIGFFYVSSYNYEQNISVRYRQLHYADQLVDKLSEGKINSIRNYTAYDRGFYKDSAWIKDLAYIQNAKPEAYSEEDSLTAHILGMFRIKFTDIAVSDNKFHISHASDSTFFYNPLLKDACKNNSGTITYRQTKTPGHYLRISASSLNYKLPSLFSGAKFNGLVFWLLLVAAIIMFYFIIYNIINRLFCLRLNDLKLWDALDEKILVNKDLNNLVFIIGLPGSGKMSRIKDFVKGKKGLPKEHMILNGDVPYIWNDQNTKDNNVFVVDFLKIPDAGKEKEREKSKACAEITGDEVFSGKYKLVIVNHFEYNIQDQVTNRIKLNFLERLMIENKSKVIILSTIHPMAFLDSAIEQSKEMPAKAISWQDLERWHVLLGHYRIVVFPLRQCSKAIRIESSMHSIYKETAYTHFLNKMQQSVADIATKLPPEERSSKADSLAFKLQVTAHYFYMYIWQSLTKEEKFLLYDLAEDNLVNSYDSYNLNMLLAKGIIMQPDGTLQLFNKGFRNFVLTAIGNTEAMKIKNRIRDTGNWSSLKNPLLIVLLAILTFLLTFQEEAYSRIIAYVAALATGVPTIIRLFSVFNKPSSDKPAA